MMNPPKNEWMDQWQALSRQYWNAWQDLTREAGRRAGRDPPATPWHEGFEQWSRMFGGRAASRARRSSACSPARKSFSALMQSMDRLPRRRRRRRDAELDRRVAQWLQHAGRLRARC